MIEQTETIIDNLLMRMSDLDRYSDDEIVICNTDLHMFDVVVCCETGGFGVIRDASIESLLRLDRPVRTIFETEAVEARKALREYLPILMMMGLL